MMSVNSILFTAVFVFSLMLVGVVLTAIEFRALRREKSAQPVSGDETQTDYHRRHTIALVSPYGRPPRQAQERVVGAERRDPLHDSSLRTH